jgi:hypothetical protein
MERRLMSALVAKAPVPETGGALVGTMSPCRRFAEAWRAPGCDRATDLMSCWPQKRVQDPSSGCDVSFRPLQGVQKQPGWCEASCRGMTGLNPAIGLSKAARAIIDGGHNSQRRPCVSLQHEASALTRTARPRSRSVSARNTASAVGVGFVRVVQLAISPHAAPAPAGSHSQKAGVPDSPHISKVMVPHARAPQRHARQEAAGAIG